MDNTYHPGDIPTVFEKDESPHASDKHSDPSQGLFLEDGGPTNPANHVDDVFGQEAGHDIKYKTLSWQMVALLMITEIVSNGTLSLPSSLAVVGVVPGVIIIFVLGAFATYTSWILVQFKIRHPEVHSMGDAGNLMFGPFGRDILAAGTVLFAIFGTGSQFIAGQAALTSLSDGRLCALAYTGIIAAATLAFSSFRTLDHISYLSALAAAVILLAGLLGMIGAGLHPVAGRTIDIAVSSDFVTAFSAITNPVFAYAGHFMFFILISEMRNPKDAMKSAWVLQIFATSFYIVFAVVTYYYIGSDVQSPSFLSLTPLWAKISFGFGLPNFIIAGSLYSHTAAKLIFVRMFRKGKHLHSHTLAGWGTWIVLIVLCNGVAFVLAVGVPIFNYLVGLTASLFAAWYTYGLAGMFWFHDTYHDKGGVSAWAKRPAMTGLNAFTVLAGLFICVAGLYSTIQGIIMAYATGEVPPAFTCGTGS